MTRRRGPEVATAAPVARPGAALDVVGVLLGAAAVLSVTHLGREVLGRTVTPLWALPGLAVAVLLWRGSRSGPWWGLAAVGLAALALPLLDATAVAAAATGAAVAVLVGWAATRSRPALAAPVALADRLLAAGVLALLVPAAAAVASTLTAAALGLPVGWSRLFTWFAADSVGCLLMPWALVFWRASAPSFARPGGRAAEVVLASAALVAATLAMVRYQDVPLSLLPTLPMAWIALRWYERGVLLAVYAVATVVAITAATGAGVFAHDAGAVLQDDLLRVWGLVVLLLAGGVAVAHVARQRDEARARLHSDNRALAATVVEGARTLETLVSNLPGVAYRCRNDATYAAAFVSEGVRDLIGVDPGALTAGPGGFAAFIHPDDLPRVWAEVDAAVAEGRPYLLGYRMRRADGAVRWVWEQGRGVGADEEGGVWLEGFIYDVTQLVAAQRVLADEARLLDVAVRRGTREELLDALGGVVAGHLPGCEVAVVVLDDEGVVAGVRTAAGAPAPDWCPITGAGLPAGPLDEAGRGERSEAPLPGATGARPVRLTAIPVGGDGEPVTAVLAVASPDPLTAEVTDPVAHLAVVAAAALGHIDAQERLVVESRQDRLTGLPNRLGIEEALQGRYAAAARPVVGVLFFDLAAFRMVNETYGHVVGDDVLRAMAHRLRSALPDGVLLGRFSGDQFVVVVDDDVEDALLAMAGLVQRVATGPYRIGEQSVHLDVTVGVAGTAGGPVSPTLLLTSAATACDAARARGGDAVMVFDEELRERSRRSLHLQTALRRAVAGTELETWYQPQFDLRTGVLVGAEALVRWRTSDQEVLSPADFLAAAESSGLMTPLGLRVLTTACQDATAWPALQAMPMVSVNVAAAQLVDPMFATTVADVLRFTRLPASRLCLEVTESAFVDVDAAAASLERIKRLGVTIAIDDFGTGFSALSRLKRIPVDVLKIDRSFVAGVGRDSHDTAIVNAVVALARALRVRTVAEGVETPAQAGELRARGVDVGQGYLWARPMPAPALLDVLAAGGHGSLRAAVSPLPGGD